MEPSGRNQSQLVANRITAVVAGGSGGAEYVVA
jgi:hypothetical protein